MLYFIYGTDRAKGLKYFQALREKLALGANVETVHEGSVSGEVLDEAVSTRGLFGEKTLYVLDGILEKKGDQEILASRAEALALSPNYFLIFEPTFTKDLAGEISAHATESLEYVAPKADTRPAFNIFSLGDALGNRNKKDLWVLYQQAVATGLGDEEVCGTLLWSVKNMALMKNEGAGDAGLNPFVAKKSRSFARNYTSDEIVGLSRKLVILYHEAHRGGEPMNIALERFILAL